MKATPVAFDNSLIGVSMLMGAASAQLPDTVAAPGETAVTTLHAEGAQVYECKANAVGKLAWQSASPPPRSSWMGRPGPALRRADLGAH